MGADVQTGDFVSRSLSHCEVREFECISMMSDDLLFLRNELKYIMAVLLLGTDAWQ